MKRTTVGVTVDNQEKRNPLEQKDDREEGEEYDDSAIGTYIVKQVYGADSLKLVGHISIER